MFFSKSLILIKGIIRIKLRMINKNMQSIQGKSFPKIDFVANGLLGDQPSALVLSA